MKIYKEYKEIPIEEIKMIGLDLSKAENLDRISRYKNAIKKEGIKRPFEVVKAGKEYHVFGDSIKLLAAKTMQYKTVPCLIRDIEKEIFFRKIMKKLMITEELFQ